MIGRWFGKRVGEGRRSPAQNPTCAKNRAYLHQEVQIVHVYMLNQLSVNQMTVQRCTGKCTSVHLID